MTADSTMRVDNLAEHRQGLCEAGVPGVLGLNFGRPWPCPEPAASDPYLVYLRYTVTSCCDISQVAERAVDFSNKIS